MSAHFSLTRFDGTHSKLYALFWNDQIFEMALIALANRSLLIIPDVHTMAMV
jgi:hypothetical protein